MQESIRVTLEDQSQTGEARRTARRLAQNMGFDEIRAEQISIVVTEACTNLLKHARGGEILLCSSSDHPELELLALDKGPGMANLEQCLRDGFSTGSSPGEGLGAIQRLSTASDFYSDLTRGTALLARWSPVASNGKESIPGPGLRVGSVNVCKPGQEVCGDSWGTEQTDKDSTFLVADGLGHGPEAKTASQEAVRMLHANPSLQPAELVELAHKALRSSRGAALAVARIDRVKGVVTFSGVGNIAGQVYSGAQAGPHLVSVNGTAGHQTQRIREFSYPWPDNGMLVMHSDGLSTHTSLDSHAGLALHDPSLIAGVLYRDFARGNDDATVVVARSA